jgi:FkbM family methyltransferase
MVTRRWLGSAYVLLSQSRLVRFLRRAPLLGTIVHTASHLVLPWNIRIWVEVESGPGKGIKLRLNPRYDLGYWHGDYEKEIQTIFTEYLKPEAVVYDVGANIGFFALLAARLVGSRGHVFAFEPDPDNSSRLQENIEANSLKHVSVISSPVWSSNTRVFFVRSSDHSTRFVGSVRMPGVGTEGFYEQAVTLDNFAKHHPAPDFIKMDIEGGEAQALAGASGLFTQAKPLLLLEVHTREAQEYSEKWLEEQRYNYEWLHPGPHRLPCHLIALPEPSAWKGGRGP